MNHSSPQHLEHQIGPISDLLQLKTPRSFLFFPLSTLLFSLYLYISWSTNSSTSQNLSFPLPFLCPYFSFIPISPSTNSPVSTEKSLKIPRPISPYKLKQERPFYKTSSKVREQKENTSLVLSLSPLIKKPKKLNTTSLNPLQKGTAE